MKGYWIDIWDFGRKVSNLENKVFNLGKYFVSVRVMPKFRKKFILRNFTLKLDFGKINNKKNILLLNSKI